MDSEEFPSARDLVKCCDCGCSCSLNIDSSGTWLRSVKRKYEEFADNYRLSIPGFNTLSVAKVQIENECVALREMVSNQQQAIQDLYVELEEERNASSSAANEAMSMILRLQREKAEIQMESRQFKRFAEEKMAHDLQELYELEELLYKREQAIHSLNCEVHAYKHRMMSFGLTKAEAEGERSGAEVDTAECELPSYDYPPLKCNVNEAQATLEDENDNDIADIEKYAFGETPLGRDHLKNFENRILFSEKSPRYSQVDGDFSGSKNVLEKVIVGQSPKRSRHSRKLSTDSASNIGIIRESGPDFSAESPRHMASFRKESIAHQEEYSNLRRMDNTSEVGDDMSDRVYTIDSVHNGAAYNGFSDSKAGAGICEDYLNTPRGSMNQVNLADLDIQKLYMRLQALEADRESMRQALISMRTDKAQVVLLKEIAQHLCKEMGPEKRVVQKKPSLAGSISFGATFKWIMSFIFWKKKARRSKHLSALSNNKGLLMLLHKDASHTSRCLTSAQV